MSYRFTVRTPCLVAVKALDNDALLVTIDLQERADGREFQSPVLPPRDEETYSNDDLDRLSPGTGSRIGLGEALIEGLSAIFVGLGYAAYIRYILGRGMKTDIFEPLPDINVLDPSGGVSDVPVQQIAAGAGVVSGDDQPYPITGWLEAYWGPVIF